jgi:hypothetical protein
VPTESKKNKRERNNFIAFGSFFYVTQKEAFKSQLAAFWHKKKHLGQKVKVILINLVERDSAVCADMENKSSLCAQEARRADNAHTLI